MSSSASADASTVAGYAQRLRTAIQERLAVPGLTFAALLADLDGADPVAVVRQLELLAPGDSEAVRLLARARAREAPEPPAPRPIPHPLDYAWAFTTETSGRLVRRLAALTAPGNRVAHLGTPTLHAHAAKALGDRDHVLVDYDARRVAAAEGVSGGAVLADLLDGSLLALSADACVSDPPWYPEQAACFVNAAAALLRPGGALLLAFAGALTRPGLAEDRGATLTVADADGLVLEAAETRGCRYVTPPFEYAAMASAGVLGVPAAWRTGELLVLRRDNRPAPSRRSAPPTGWSSVDVGDIPLRVRETAPPTGGGLLDSLVPGDVLATVSRRDPIRARAALWTSRNRIFGSADPNRLCDVVRAVAAGDQEDLGEEECRAAERIRAIAVLERQEHGLA